MDTKELYARLCTRKNGLELFDAEWQLITDVLDNDVKKTVGDRNYSEYITQGRLEADSEYSRRIEMTPWFPQTPTAAANRQGALFGRGITITPTQTEEDQAKTEALAEKALELVQAHGYVGAWIQNDGIRLYAAPAILDWQDNYVKIYENCYERENWADHEERIEYFTVITAESATEYRVTKPNTEEMQITVTETPNEYEAFPFVFCHPLPGDDDIGRPVLLRAAESDIAATRILSDITWTLFLLGSPILTFNTNKREDELNALNTAASRYIPLDAGRPNETNPESLQFVQLDPTGLEMQFRAHRLCMRQGLWSQDGAGEDIADRGAIPQVQSGIAQAWRFKTGEERILFLLARAIEKFVNACFAVATLPTKIKLPDAFDEDAPATPQLAPPKAK